MKKSRFFYKVAFFCLFVFPLFLVMPIVQDLLTRTLIIFPAKDGNRIEPLTDALWNGNSSIEDFTYDSEKIFVKYILKNSNHSYPNVFIILWLDKNKPYIDLSGYKYITLRIKEASPQKVTLFIKTFEQGISTFKHQDAAALRHNAKVLSLSPSTNFYKINLSEFVTPQWWYNTFHTSEKLVGDEEFKKVVSFDLHFIHLENGPVKEEMKTLIIEEIVFHKPISPLSYFCGGILILYYGAAIALFYRKKRKKKKALPDHKHLTFVNYREKELIRIKEYIQDNYNDPNISTKKIQLKMGISSVRIYNLVKEEYNLSFKQLINQIRIQKAKSLIKESDLPIIEISYKLGYNDSSYFNKIFKQIAGITPTELRKRTQN